MFLFVLSLTPLLMIDKKGEKNLSLYACFVCMFYVFIDYVFIDQRALFKEHVYFWYQELVKEIISFVLHILSLIGI